MYRNKNYGLLKNNFLKPIFDFIGLTELKSKEYDLDSVKWIGSINKSGIEESFVTVYKKDGTSRILTLINNEEDLFRFNKFKDKLEYFNPFIKYKNTKFLLLTMLPMIYGRCCEIDEEYEDVDSVPVDILYNYIDLIQYPLQRIDGENIYHFEIVIKTESNGIVHIHSTSKHKIVVLLILMMKIIDYINNIEMKSEEYYNELEVKTKILIEKYEKDRLLNAKDLKKFVMVKTVEMTEDEIIQEEALNDIDLDSETEKDLSTLQQWKKSFEPNHPVNNSSMYNQNDAMMNMDYF